MTDPVTVEITAARDAFEKARNASGYAQMCNWAMDHGRKLLIAAEAAALTLPEQPPSREPGEDEVLRDALRKAAIDFIHTPRSNKNGAIDRHVEECRERLRIAIYGQAIAALTLPEQPRPVDLRSLEVAPGQDLSDALAHGIEWDKSDPAGLTAAIYHACETIRAALGHKDRGGE